MVNYEVSALNPAVTSSSTYVDTSTSFTTYVNGDVVLRDRTKYRQDTTFGEGKLVIGKTFTSVDKYYTSMVVSQVALFNQVLSREDIIFLLTRVDEWSPESTSDGSD